MNRTIRESLDTKKDSSGKKAPLSFQISVLERKAYYMGEIDFTQVKTVLQAGGHACVVENGTELATADARGIQPLVQFLREKPELLRGAIVADRVVGKAAAFLLAYGGATAIWAGTLSETAVPVLEQHGIAYACEELVPYIENRDKTGPCPMEQRAMALQTPEEAFTVFNTIVPQSSKP